MATLLATASTLSVVPVNTSASPNLPLRSTVRVSHGPGLLGAKSRGIFCCLKASKQDLVEGAKDASADVQQGPKEAGEVVKETLQGLREGISDAVEQVSDAARDMTRSGEPQSESSVDKARQDAGGVLQDLRERAEEARDSIGGRIQDAADNLKAQSTSLGDAWGWGVLRVGAAFLLALGFVVSSPAAESLAYTAQEQGPKEALESVRGGIERTGVTIREGDARGPFSSLLHTPYGPVASILDDVQQSLGGAGDNIKGATSSIRESGPVQSIQSGIKEAQAEGRKGAGSLRDWEGKEPQSQVDTPTPAEVSTVGEGSSQVGDFLKGKASELSDVIQGGVSSADVTTFSLAAVDTQSRAAGQESYAPSSIESPSASAVKTVGENVQGKKDQATQTLKSIFGGKERGSQSQPLQQEAGIPGSGGASAVGEKLKGKASEIGDAIKKGVSSADITTTSLANVAEGIAGSGDKARQGVSEAGEGIQRNVGKPLEMLKKGAEDVLSAPQNAVREALRGGEVGRDANINLPQEEKRFRAKGSGARMEVERSSEGYNP